MSGVVIDMIPNVLEDVRPEWLEALGIPKDCCKGARVLVVTGDNAAGKSLFRRLLTVFLGKRKVEVIHLSQQGRATAGFQRAMIYGSEDDEATGAISAHTLLTGFKTSRARDKDHVLIYDEPEIGMSEEVQLGAGYFIVQQLADFPPKLRGLVIMTHSRHIVSAAMRCDGAKFVNLGGKYKTAEEWLNRPLRPVNIEDVKKAGHENWQKFSKLLKG